MKARNIKNINNVQTLFNEALSLHASGNTLGAIKLYRKVLKAEPKFIPALNNMASALWQQKKSNEALSYVRKSLRLDPKNVTALNTKGLIQTSCAEFVDAEKSFHLALSLKPDYVECYFNLARLYFINMRWQNALKTAERLLEINPDHKNAKMLHLAALAELDRFNEFDQDWLDVFEGSESNVFANYLRGRIYFLCASPDNAIQAFDQALLLDEDNILALQGKASTLIDLDKKEDAKACLEKILSINPLHTLALKSYAGLHRFKEEDDVYKKIKRIQKKENDLSEIERSNIYYALAKYFSDIGDQKATFEHWQKAAKQKHALCSYDFSLEEKKLSEIKLRYEGAKKLSVGKDSAVPVFILGMPRSGTSLIEQVLASHKDVLAKGELRTLSRALSDSNELNEARESYLDDLCKDVGSATHVSDKMPYNYRYLGLIYKMLPQAKIIHTKRNPLDVCLSCFSISFHTGHEWSYNFDELASYYKLYDQMMDYWRQVLPADAFLEIEYEKLVTDFKGQVKTILEYCDLSWDEACLDFYKNKRVIGTASTQQVRKPIYSSSIERWKQYKDDFAPLAEQLKEIMAKQGYKL